MCDDIRSHGLNVILIQIDEAHSSAWPMGLKDEPEPQTSFGNRMDRAKLFIEKYDCPYDVYVDGWNNIFETTFRAWPDKFHCVKHTVSEISGENEFIVVSKSEYHRSGEKEAVIIDDYTEILDELIQKNL